MGNTAAASCSQMTTEFFPFIENVEPKDMLVEAMVDQGDNVTRSAVSNDTLRAIQKGMSDKEEELKYLQHQTKNCKVVLGRV